MRTNPLYSPEDGHGACDSSTVSWASIAKIYPPQDLIVSSMLKSCGIPFKTQRREVSQLPVSIGPLAEVEIFVPNNLADEARALIESTVEETEKE
ncbi:hypothetical protein [Syntrophomonas curvata]